ncbi:hypothetical protein TH8_11085 [Thalassospira profundimaris]|nr:hypothetical protein TH8_11085 [Thalassospira profundimaris]
MFTFAHGRSPGLRIDASSGLPEMPSISVTMVGLKLATYSCGGSFGIVVHMQNAPNSLLAFKPIWFGKKDRDAYILGSD